MSEPKKRPALLWLFFYGRKRKGFPWLLVIVLVALMALAISFAVPGGADMWRTVAPFALGFLILSALMAAVVAAVIPRRRR